MNIILAGLLEKTILADGLRKRGCSVGFVPFDALERYLLLEGARIATHFRVGDKFIVQTLIPIPIWVGWGLT